MAAFGALFDHVSKLYMRLDFINEENLKLLNGMHEGVMIMSKPSETSQESKLLFGNKSAQKVFAKIVDDSELEIQKRKIFVPLKATSTESLEDAALSIE